MKKLFRYIKPYLPVSLLSIGLMLLEVFMDLRQPALMSNIINNGVIKGDTAYILRTCLIMFACALIGAIGGVGNNIFSTKAGYGFAHDLRKAIYERIQAFSFDNINKFKTGSLVTRVTNDVTQVQNAFTSCIRMLVRAPFLCIGGVACVFSINAKLAWIVLAAVPVILLLAVFMVKYTFPMFDKMQKKLDRVNVIMQENLAGVRVIKAFGRSNYEKKRFGKSNDELMEIGMKAMTFLVAAFPIINFIINMAVIIMYRVGGGMVIDGTGGLQPGDIMAFSNYVTQILSSFTMASMVMMFVSRAKVSIDRVNEVLDTESDIKDAEGSTKKVENGRVEFRHVSFSYPGQSGEPVLNDISFTAEAGETVAILGSTGSGKTTMVSLIPRLYDASDGEVLVDGVNVKDYRLHALRGEIGVALQESLLFTGTIDENLHWGDENASEEAVLQATKVAQADPFVQKMTDKYETELGQGGVNLSGGQKQRLCIARALVKHPKILILDDSTSAVDLATEAEIQKGMREVMGDITVFIIAQRISSVMDADKIIVLDNGRIVDIGKHNELKKRCDVYKEIVVSQMGKEAL